MPALTGMVFDSPSILGALIGVFSLDAAQAMKETTLRTIEMLNLLLTQNSVLDPSAANKMIAARSGIVALIQQLMRDIDPNSLSPEQKTRFTRAVSTSGSVSGLQQGLQNSNFGEPGRSSAQREAVIIKPQYVRDTIGNKTVERIIKPNHHEEKYKELGVDKIGQKNKYYRLRLTNELEKSEFVSSSVFGSARLTRGKQLRTKKTFFDKIFGGDKEYSQVGYFKGNFSVFKQRTLDGLMNLSIPTLLEQVNLPVTNLEGGGLSKIDQDIVKERDVRVRIYLIDASIFGTFDMGSDPDVYTEFYLGDKLIQDNKASRIDNNSKPKFYSMTEFKTKLPGPSLLKIKFMDYDPFKSDDYIGTTEIDLERRYFDPLWRAEVEHPIEKRNIYVNTMGQTTGHVNLWVEIDPMDDASRMLRPAQKIAPIEPMNLELRVVVWEVHDVPSDDPLSDVYVVGAFQSLGMSAVTDTHWRADEFVGAR